MALDEGMPDCKLTESVDVQSASETSAHPFSNVSPPSGFCTKIVLTNESGELCFGRHIRGENFRYVLVHKHVTFAVCSEMTQEQAQTSLCRIYCRKFKVDKFFVATESHALAALKKADALFLCPGCGIEPIKTGQCTKFGESYYSHACSVRTAKGKECFALQVHQEAYSKSDAQTKQNPKPKLRQRAARQSVQLLRTRRKLAKAQETVEKLRLVNQSVADTAFEQKISGLPPKQRLAVRTCFKAASKKSSCGMAYDKLWVLECILMRMKSPQLYEHIRKHEIMTLPSKTCLDKHLQRFKSTFGFNPKVFSAPEQKTKEINEFSHHRGVMIGVRVQSACLWKVRVTKTEKNRVHARCCLDNDDDDGSEDVACMRTCGTP
ncbi:hypothetical protein HPB51_008429 [Rhipicephalus microplus]|uniref:Uncharacterized protein n=1 Tax=Rhipicephalus microplus TaxID=6941 RepID=A0A9J6EFH6_RHIMP|nr:hypothetical protein HPB51_008429 [Rhipicephalus microplus]